VLFTLDLFNHQDSELFIKEVIAIFCPKHKDEYLAQQQVFLCDMLIKSHYLLLVLLIAFSSSFLVYVPSVT